MKRISILLISILISITATYANGIQYFDHVRLLYEQGRYEEAIQGFNACKRLYYDELDVASINNWISKCNSKINERNVAIQARREAKIAEAKRRAEEALLAEERRAYEAKQQERIEKKLLYVSSNAFLFDKEYLGMHQAIKENIADNSEQRFTDDPEMAYYGVYISAIAYPYRETPNNRGESIYYSNVIAYVKIVNEITQEIIYEGEVEDSLGGYKNHEESAKHVYQRKINSKIANKILKYING